MFIDTTLRRNQALIEVAAKLHQAGEIPPNTYVIDLDQLGSNVAKLSHTATECNMQLYYMTKQIGRSGWIGRYIQERGIPKAVAVDIDEAYALRQSGAEIGNIGHIVQPGQHQWKQVITSLKPEVVTLFSFERAQQLSAVCAELGTRQDVILRVIRADDFIYPGQWGGFLDSELEQQLLELKKLKRIRIIGVTSFPALKMNEAGTDFEATPNLETLRRSVTTLERMGIAVQHVNAPGATSCASLPILKAYGVTHGEPGHAMTGTTPLHAVRDDLAEVPSAVY
ncbi:MAG: alanine racemase, partial [Bacilli bacterium]